MTNTDRRFKKIVDELQKSILFRAPKLKEIMKIYTYFYNTYCNSVDGTTFHLKVKTFKR